VPVKPPPIPDAAKLGDVPAGRGTVSDRLRLAQALGPLSSVNVGLLGVIDSLERWHKVIAKARGKTLRAAHRHL
jgi:hypothetical protein